MHPHPNTQAIHCSGQSRAPLTSSLRGACRGRWPSPIERATGARGTSSTLGTFGSESKGVVESEKAVYFYLSLYLSRLGSRQTHVRVTFCHTRTRGRTHTLLGPRASPRSALVRTPVGSRKSRRRLGRSASKRTPPAACAQTAVASLTMHVRMCTTTCARAARLGPWAVSQLRGSRVSGRRGGDPIGHDAVEFRLPLRQPRRPVGEEAAAPPLLTLAQLARVPALTVRRVVACVALPVGLGLG